MKHSFRHFEVEIICYFLYTGMLEIFFCAEAFELKVVSKYFVWYFRSAGQFFLTDYNIFKDRASYFHKIYASCCEVIAKAIQPSKQKIFGTFMLFCIFTIAHLLRTEERFLEGNIASQKINCVFLLLRNVFMIPSCCRQKKLQCRDIFSLCRWKYFQNVRIRTVHFLKSCTCIFSVCAKRKFLV